MSAWLSPILKVAVSLKDQSQSELILYRPKYRKWRLTATKRNTAWCPLINLNMVY